MAKKTKQIYVSNAKNKKCKFVQLHPYQIYSILLQLSF